MTESLRPSRFRLSMHRSFLAVAISLATVWAWAAVMLWRQEKSDAEFMRRVVQPEVDHAKQEVDRLQQALKEGRSLDPFKVQSMTSLNESLERMRVRNRYWSIRDDATIGLFATGFCWVMASQIQMALRRRAREALERPASPNAGHLVGELVQLGRSFLARAEPDGSGVSIEVDGKRALVTFRNLTFIAAFTGNKRQAIVELPFSELLALTVGMNKGTAFLNLRTTAGRVYWTDRVRPFDTLAALLDDIIEFNRTSPETYSAARAREPVVRTPWYGWLMIAAALVAVAAVWWWMLQH